MPIPIGTDLSQGSVKRDLSAIKKKKKRKASATVTTTQTPTRPGMFGAPMQQTPKVAGALPQTTTQARPTPYSAPDPTAQLGMIDKAYVHLHGTHPSASLAAQLLISLPIGRTQEDYEAILAPGLQPLENPLAPSAKAGRSEATEIAAGRRRAAALKLFAVDGDEPDISNSNWSDLYGGPLTPGESDKPGINIPMLGKWSPGYSETGDIDVNLVRYNLDTIRSMAGEARDSDFNRYDRLEQEMLMGDWTAFTSIFAQRVKQDGGSADWSDGEVSKNTLAAYCLYVWDRVMPDYVLGEDEKAAKAWDVMAVAAEGAYGNRSGEILDAAKVVQSQYREMSTLGAPDDAFLYDLYRRFLRGRGLNQTESQGMWDYIERYGRDALPAEAQAKAQEESLTFADVLDKSIGRIFREAGEAGAGGIAWGGEHLNPVDWVLEVGKHAPGSVGDWMATADAWNSNIWEASPHVTEGALSGEWFGKAIAYTERAAVTLEEVANMAGWLDPDYLHGEGQWEGKEGSEKVKYALGQFTSVANWHKAWKQSGNRMIVDNTVAHVGEMFGFDPQEVPLLPAAVAALDLYAAVKIGAKFDSFGRTGLRAAPKAMLTAGRTTWDVGVRARGRFVFPTGDIVEPAATVGKSASGARSGKTPAAPDSIKEADLEHPISTPEGRREWEMAYGWDVPEGWRPNYRGWKDGKQTVSVSGPGIEPVDFEIAPGENFRTAYDVALAKHNELMARSIESAKTHQQPAYEPAPPTDFVSGFKVGDRVSDVVPDEFGIERLVEGEVVEIIDGGETLRVETPQGELLFNSRVAKRAVAPVEATARAEQAKESGPATVGESASGVKVVKTSVGEVDASAAPDIEAINRAGYKTFGSHGAKADHPAGHPAEDINPYIEFSYRENTGKMREIRAAGKAAGASLEKSGNNLVVSFENIDKMHDFTTRLTGEKVAAQAVDYTHYPKILQTLAERIAEMPEGNPSALRSALGIPKVGNWKEAIIELDRAKTPQAVMEVAVKYDLEFDLAMPGVFRQMRFDAITSGSVSQIAAKFRVFGTPISLMGRVPVRDADIHMYNLAKATKMGFRTWNAEAKKRAAYWRERFFAAENGAEMQNMLGRLDREGVPVKTAEKSFWREVYENVGDKEWKKWMTFRARMLKFRGRMWSGEIGHGRGYDVADRVIPAGYRKRLQAKYDAKREELAEKAAYDAVEMAKKHGTPKAELAQIEKALEETKREMRMYDQAHRILAKGKGEKGMSLEEARRYSEDIAHPEPIGLFQMRQGLQHPFDPRLFTWFMQGNRTAPLLRSLMYLENLPVVGLAHWTKLFKLVALGTMGFPLRVLAGDEFTRLVPEGVGIGYGSLLGSRRYREAKRTVQGLKERDELGPEISKELYDDLNANWLSDFADDYRVVAPEELSQTLNGWRTMGDYMRKLSKEPLFEAWLAKGTERPTGRAEIRQFLVDELSRQDDTGEALRAFLLDTLRVTEPQTDLATLRKLLARPDTVTGAAGNLNRFLESWCDKLGKIGNSERLYRVFRDHDFSQRSLERIPKDSLWAIPVREGNYNSLGMANPFNWAQKWYEGIDTGRLKNIPGLGVVVPEQVGVMPLLVKLTNQMREAFFGDRYNREMAILRDKDPNIDPHIAHEIAAERAIEYVNSVTYVREATVFEDMIRNVIPFVNSYRQFAVYWAKALAKHPFAFSAFYQNDPLRGVMGFQYRDSQYFLPPVPFWIPQTKEDDSPSGFLRNSAANLNPFLSETFGGVLRGPFGIESDISQVPLLGGTSRSWAPFGRASRALASFGIFLGPFGVEKQTVRREHMEILRAITEVPAGEIPAGYQFEPDYPVPMDWAYKLGIMPYPEQFHQFLTSTVTPLSQKYNPDQKAMVDGLKRVMNTGTPHEVAAYIEENPEADQLYQVWEEDDMGRRNQLIAKYPWTEPYCVSIYDYSQSDGKWIPTIADFIAKNQQGLIKIYEKDEEYYRALRRRHVSIFGGRRRNTSTGAMEYYPGDLSAADAEKAYKAQMKTAKQWAKAEATALAGGNAELAKQYYDEWENGFEDPAEGHRMPGMFEAAAIKQGKNPADYDPVQLTVEFEAQYGDRNRLQSNGLSESTKTQLATLIESGVMGPGFQIAVESFSAFAPDVRKAREDLIVSRRKASLSPATAAFYDMDGKMLCKMVGIDDKYAPGLDAALVKVRGYYYNTLQPIRDQYGAQSSEARAAKLEFDKFRDKTFGAVKGGKYFIGGTPERILAMPYFNHPKFRTVATGHGASRQEQLWDEFVAEARSAAPDPEKLQDYYDHFGKTNRQNWAEVARVNNMVYVAGMASYYRAVMKTSPSEYYGGPGNSILTNLGKQMKGHLLSLMRDVIEDGGGKEASLFYRDVVTYFESPKALASDLLEWQYH